MSTRACSQEGSAFSRPPNAPHESTRGSPVTVPHLSEMKARGKKIAAITAYDYPSALLADGAQMDLILVGDSLANTALGYATTLPVTMEEMLVAVRAVRRGVVRGLLVADMPFGSFQAGDDAAVEAAIQFVKAGAHAIKLEGGRHRTTLVRRLVENGIPVLGHIGLTPQSINAMGGYKVQGRSPEARETLIADARSLEAAGAFAIVLEGIPGSLGGEISALLHVPSIGIGAGPSCDGQILVFSDVLGWLPGKPPKFARRYADIRELAGAALRAYADDVRAGTFPAAAETYGAPAKRETLAAP